MKYATDENTRLSDRATVQEESQDNNVQVSSITQALFSLFYSLIERGKLIMILSRQENIITVTEKRVLLKTHPEKQKADKEILIMSLADWL